MTELYYLSDSDRRKLLDLKRRVDALWQNVRNRPLPGENIDSAPSVYVVRAPNSTGIPSAPAQGDLGQADCTIYRSHLSPGTASTNDLDLESIGVPLTVFNPSPALVPENSFTLAMRDKFGAWFVAPEPSPSHIIAINWDWQLHPFDLPVIIDSNCTALWDDTRTVQNVVMFQQTGPSSGKLVVNDASNTMYGAINVGTQDWGGIKFLEGILTVGENTDGQHSFGGSQYVSIIQPGDILFNNPTSMQLEIFGGADDTQNTNNGSAAFIVDCTWTGTVFFEMAGPNGFAGVGIVSDHRTTIPVNNVFTTGYTLLMGCYALAIDQGNGPQIGGWGIDGIGNVFRGGLCVGTGSGPSTYDGGVWP